MTRTTVVLARHGRTPWHHPNRYAGRSDVPLDEVGVRQAEALARWAARAELTALVCSPLRRAVATAAPTAAATGLVPLVEPRVRELDFGVAEGRTLAELREADPALVARFEADPATYHFPGGEPPAEAVARALDALTALAADHPGGRVLVVAHNTLIRLVTCAVLGVPLAEYRRRLPALDPAATTTLRLPATAGAEPVALLAYNVPLCRGWDDHDAAEPRTT
ncbi:histidine phosphatase family protein [Micromonospora sp. NPDC049559]|uniref:histidine phosphatase family protein n=1 Tax=Micromonospora sp. NPDC049559 TaxID=3155923 RepID=UPI00343ED445